MIERIKREPVIASQLVALAIAALVAFGLELTIEQSAVVIALVETLAMLFARSRVSPVEEAPPKGPSQLALLVVPGLLLLAGCIPVQEPCGGADLAVITARCSVQLATACRDVATEAWETECAGYEDITAACDAEIDGVCGQ
jgi:hypothetical protein